MTSASPDRSTPTLAVVICTRDRPVALQRTLESIWTQRHLPSELILLDDGDLSDDIRTAIHERCRELDIRFEHAHSGRTGLTKARNLAADIAHSEVLQYLDDDVDCDPGMLAEVSRLMADPAVAAVTANVCEPTFASRSARLFQFTYRLAGWWRIAPRKRPRGTPPAVLRNPQATRRARWLSGAAMAFRRDIVRQCRFDENLAQYALGEDREMGYRLAEKHWLLEAKQARVVHRRESAGRTDSRRLGYMVGFNYLYILGRTCRMGPGQWLLAGWSLLLLALTHLAWTAGISRRQHLDEVRGMAEGVAAFLTARLLRPLAASDRPGCFPPLPGMTNRPDSPPRIRAPADAVCRPVRRVLFVTNCLEPGGAERLLVLLANNLPRFGVRPLIGCLQDAGSLATECCCNGIEIAADLLRHKHDATGLLRLQTLIREKRIDAVVAAHSGGDRMFWTTLAGHLRRIPVVVWSHWFPLPGDRHFELPNRLLYRGVRAFVALGERHRQALIRHEHVPAGRIMVIPNGIDVSPFRMVAGREAVRARLRLGAEEVVVAIVANLRREKRHDVFIRTAAELAGRHPNTAFLIIGDGPERQAVKAQAAASGLPPHRLRLLGACADIAELLGGLDIVCLCSEQECFSVTMLEAAAAGTAFVAPDTGCLGDFIEHRQTGLLTRPADAASLSAALDDLISDERLRLALAQAAQAKLLQGYQHTLMTHRFAELLHSL